MFAKFEKNISWSGSDVGEIGKDQDGKPVIRIDAAYPRSTELPFLLGDASKAREKLGWVSLYSLGILIDEKVEDELHSLPRQHNQIKSISPMGSKLDVINK